MPAAQAHVSAAVAPAARLSRRGELEEHGPGVGFMVYRPEPARSFELTSYNPRRYADSRRWWAKLKREQMNAAPATSLLTTTLPAEFHERQIDRATIDHERQAHRRFVQTLGRLVCRIDAGDVCWECLRSYRERIQKNRRARFSPCRKKRRAAHKKPWHGATGNCAHCCNWMRIHWYPPELEHETGETRDPRGAWLCASCAGTRTPGKPRVRLVWIREPGKSLRHLHRHAKFDGPFMPQWLLSTLAQRAGLGRVLDVRRFRPGAILQAPLVEYLTKTAGTRALDPLSSYFVKTAAHPDEFNALPKGIPRCRAPRLKRGPSDWCFLRWRPGERVSVSMSERWLLPEQYLEAFVRFDRGWLRSIRSGNLSAATSPANSPDRSRFEGVLATDQKKGREPNWKLSPSSGLPPPNGESGGNLENTGSSACLQWSVHQNAPVPAESAERYASGSLLVPPKADSAFQFMTETKERLELSSVAQARAPNSK